MSQSHEEPAVDTSAEPTDTAAGENQELADSQVNYLQPQELHDITEAEDEPTTVEAQTSSENEQEALGSSELQAEDAKQEDAENIDENADVKNEDGSHQEDGVHEPPQEGNPVDYHEALYQEQKRKDRELLIQELTEKSSEMTAYFENTEKEQKVLDYVDNFNRQYQLLFPHRKTLLLNMKNEFNTVKKFVCTTIRPTQLPYKELYDYKGCARFVADYLTYVPLDPPHELPTSIPSPSYTLKMQEGNCFDLSILLTSLLCGVGYDAYVVSGYASHEFTLMDESHTTVSQLEMLANALGFYSNFTEDRINKKDEFWMVGREESLINLEEEKEAEYGDRILSQYKTRIAEESKYRTKAQRELASQFVAKQEQKWIIQQKELAEKKRIQAAAERAKLNEIKDELQGLRVHAWVLVLPGKREVAEAFFIEPSTGKVFSTDNKNILGIESVFNFANYWVNMQVCVDGMKGISLDLGDNSKWEFVLLDNTQPGMEIPGENQQEDEEEEEGNPEILDLPPSWVEKLTLSKENFQARCPSGAKTVIFQNARLEMFAEYHREDGLVARISLFADADNDFNGEIKEIFRNRKDKLWQRVRNPDIDQVHEYFEPGRPHGLKDHIMQEGKTKEWHFYASSRSDGLVKRIEEPKKIMEYFVSRDDKLVYRSVAFDSLEMEGQTRSPYKLTEKFDPNPALKSHQSPYKKTYFLKEEKEFKKPSSDQKGSSLDLGNYFEVNPHRPKPKKQQLFGLLIQLTRCEQTLQNSIKASDREMKEILASRRSEENDISLIVSVYDTVRNNDKLPEEEVKDANSGEIEDEQAADLDYLSPFLVNRGQTDKLSKEEALAVRDACLKSMKERIVEKTNIIQSRLDEVGTEYQRRQLAYSRNADAMSVEETEEYVNFCNNALFKIHILEKRLAKHKESVPERYMELDAKLHAEKKLAAAYL
ncbi:MAG: hypothetical protein SGCHY_002920 [Lobulomycetales sp.]